MTVEDDVRGNEDDQESDDDELIEITPDHVLTFLRILRDRPTPYEVNGEEIAVTPAVAITPRSGDKDWKRKVVLGYLVSVQPDSGTPESFTVLPRKRSARPRTFQAAEFTGEDPPRLIFVSGLANRNKVREAHTLRYVRRQYGLTREQFTALVEVQDARCAGCGGLCEWDDDLPGGGPTLRLVVDHCHTTGKVRGLLCDGCNKAVGFARDDPQILRALADYLERTAN